MVRHGEERLQTVRQRLVTMRNANVSTLKVLL